MKARRAHLVIAVALLAAALTGAPAPRALASAPPESGARLREAPSAPPAEPSEADLVQQRATAAFEARDFSAARAALERLIELKGNNPAALYNLACALAQTGEVEGAGRRLYESVGAGFVDFFHMESDPHLTPIRQTREYRAIVSGWRELLDAGGDAVMTGARRTFGGRCTYTRDPALRLVIAAAFDEKTYAEARQDIDQVAKWAFANVFTDLSFDDGSNPRPDPWVSVVIPTPEDFVSVVRSANVGGFYDHDRRRLISQDIGPSFRHEFLHVLHWRHLSRIDQRHPDWIMEGLGTLVEDFDADENGALMPVPSWRTNIVKRLESAGRLTPWRTLMTMPRRQFIGARPNAQYAQCRAIMLFLHSHGMLTGWYRAYVEGYDEDPTGVSALERVFGRPLADIERDHREWVRALPDVAERIRPGMASLGVVIGAGRGDGPVVEEVAPGEAGAAAGLRPRDVITAIDGRATRTMEDLVRILSECDPGDKAVVSVRRGTLRLALDVTLGRAE